MAVKSLGSLAVIYSASAPIPTQLGQLWVDTDANPPELMIATDLDPVTFEPISGGGGGGTPAGSNFSIQYNNGGSFGGTGPGSAGEVLVSIGAGGQPAFTSPQFNVSPDLHALTAANVANDEFEGGSLDTTGTRFSGATAWAWVNQQGATATLLSGSCILTLPGDNDQDLAIIRQVVPGGAWKYRAKISGIMWKAANVAKVGMCVMNSSGDKLMFMNINTNGVVAIQGRYYSDPHTNTGVSMSLDANNPYFDITNGTYFCPMPIYYEIESDGTSVFWRFSVYGTTGTFYLIGTETIADNLGAVDRIGFCLANDNSAPCTLVIDWFRRIS